MHTSNIIYVGLLIIISKEISNEDTELTSELINKRNEIDPYLVPLYLWPFVRLSFFLGLENYMFSTGARDP